MSESSPRAAAENRPESGGLPVMVLVLLALLTAFPPVATDMYLPSLPAMSRDMGASTSTGQLTVASFFAGLAIGQLLYGPVSDRLGRRPPLLAGVLLYTVASVGCVFAPSMEVLIALRFVQALGGAAAPLIARAVVADRCKGIEAARTFSLLMLIMGLAPILAPTFGGFVLLAGGWRAIFWILTGFGALALVWALLALPESLPASVRASRPREAALAAYRQVLSNRTIMVYGLVAAFGSAALFAYIGNAASLIIETYGIPPAHFGWVFGLNAAALIGATQINRMLLGRYGPLVLIRRANLALLVIAGLMTLSAATGWGGMFGVLVPIFCMMATLGFTTANATALAMDVDRTRAGTVSSVVGCLQFTVGALFAAVTGAAYNGTALPVALGVLVAALSAAWLLNRHVPRLRGAGR